MMCSQWGLESVVYGVYDVVRKHKHLVKAGR